MTVISSILRPVIARNPMAFRISQWWHIGTPARWRRAIRYAVGATTLDDAYKIARDCRDVTGLYPLVELSADDVLEQAEDRFGKHPALAEIVDRACYRVFSRWESTGSELDAANSWAHDLVAEYVKDAGLGVVDGWDFDRCHNCGGTIYHCDPESGEWYCNGCGQAYQPMNE